MSNKDLQTIKFPLILVRPVLWNTHQDISQELTNGVTSAETSYEYVGDGPHSRFESDDGTKKRRVEEDLSADGIVIADCSLNEPREERVEDAGNLEDAFLREYQVAEAGVDNASVAEHVIEPTLVMFETTPTGATYKKPLDADIVSGGTDYKGKLKN